MRRRKRVEWSGVEARGKWSRKKDKNAEGNKQSKRKEMDGEKYKSIVVCECDECGLTTPC